MKLLGIILITLSCNRIPFISKEETPTKLPSRQHPLDEHCTTTESEDGCSIIICYYGENGVSMMHNPNCRKHSPILHNPLPKK